MVSIAGKLARFIFRVGLRSVYYYPKIAAAMVRGRGSGITETWDGTRRHETDVYAILIVWQPGGHYWSVRNALEALGAARVNVILVVNHRIPSHDRELLAAQVHTLLVRDNRGFDFGGYRDATIYATERLRIGRLLYLNDSVFFFREGLPEFFTSLAQSDADVCGSFENWERHYHIQSFAFSVSARIVQHPAFARFWRRYLSVDARRWAIHFGEVALSRTMVPLARNIAVIYQPNCLRPATADLPATEIATLNEYLAIPQRLDRTARHLSPDEIVNEILQRVPLRSQAHTGGLLFHRFGHCPIVKRDLVYRLQFTIYEVERALLASGRADHVDEVLAEMRKKGVGSELPLLRRLQFSDGII